MEQLVESLRALQVGEVRVNESLAHHTTWKIGGPADVFVIPNDIEGLKKTMKLIQETGCKWRVIGRGSNILVSDKGLRGVTVKLDKGLDHLEVNGESITVGAGYPVVKLATVISRQGLAGLEFAAGIPGSVGGAVFMNAGAHGSDISQILTKAHVLFPDGTLRWLTNEEMAFSYRTSLLQKNDGICVEAIFSLTRGDKEDIKKKLQKNKDYRRDTQPWNHPTCGSVFRNPLPEYAGQLIEKAGLKGYQIGGAQISTMHANFIVNTGDAKAADVLALIHHVKDTIQKQYQINMETEVELIGER
ncbi:UDP-N-acetylmuramate dehydrogenase [Halalkalibacterium halodurans]|jgi:UDP-N-acetylmuramate dehydrogenase|uniref:UDP-N-acetylmuramate dehydrogenase n=1 Tax=Halalkalibacterium halodurans TaxID=86665 RepID=UPI001068A1E4|nr:UDP-N-acetylmuramate dehydrogenase [Halalkalibacterium halodurans]MED3646131.1 UDP-N-acetylmuramate dehydrogenase [Halalkalibacterium halodurans]TES53848.1 UDP-N-acetylmuramate dehydrogenase [Halalkalibacterium halodurans]